MQTTKTKTTKKSIEEKVKQTLKKDASVVITAQEVEGGMEIEVSKKNISAVKLALALIGTLKSIEMPRDMVISIMDFVYEKDKTEEALKAKRSPFFSFFR